MLPLPDSSSQFNPLPSTKTEPSKAHMAIVQYTYSDLLVWLSFFGWSTDKHWGTIENVWVLLLLDHSSLPGKYLNNIGYHLYMSESKKSPNLGGSYLNRCAPLSHNVLIDLKYRCPIKERNPFLLSWNEKGSEDIAFWVLFFYFLEQKRKS